jgi:hypothetical protein
MIRKLKSGGYRLYSRKINPKTSRRRNPRHVQDARGGRETRTRRSVFQASLTPSSGGVPCVES